VPLVGEQDAFEFLYRDKLKALLVPYGLLIEYHEDRAALDLGLHPYKPEPGRDRVLSDARVWFQCKGVRTTTLGAAEFLASDAVVVSALRLDHVRYWYGAADPVYLVIYVEAADVFLAHEIRDLVDAAGGMAMLATLQERGQKTLTLTVPRKSRLETSLERMPHHRSIRVDGPHFRGRPLGHRYDPLRSELEPLPPIEFEALVSRLLELHDFRVKNEIDLRPMLSGEIGRVRALRGTLYLTYEWVTPLGTQFGIDGISDFRLEAQPESAHGEVLVIIHSEIHAAPSRTSAIDRFLKKCEAEGVSRALVFFNDTDLGGTFGGWFSTFQPLLRTPQGLGSLAFNVLTTTLVYLEFVDRLRWKYLNYLW
jgi:hypothetical protein